MTLLGFSLAAFGAAGCMESTESTTLSVTALPTPTVFSGATTAKNLNGTSIQVSWGAIPSTVTKLKVFNVAQDGSLGTIASLSPSSTSYTIEGLTPNTQYTYVVQSFDATGTSDGNQNTVTAMTYAGITGALATSSSAAIFTFTAPTSGTSINVYCKTATLPDTLMGSTTNATSTSLIVSSGILSGTTYTCHAAAISVETGLPDTNTALYSFQSPAVGFGTLVSGVISNSAYEGIDLVQAFGPAPNAPTNLTAPPAFPVASPTVGIVTPNVPAPWNSPTPVVNITWNAFNVANPLAAQYRVERVAQGGVFNMNSTTTCTSTTTTSCQVCLSPAQSVAAPRTCTDIAPGVSPAIYEYAVSLIINASVTPPIAEELPTTYTGGVLATAVATDAPFRILVPIPPANMVLVQRDSANFEMCNLLNLTTDPLNHQRCSYSGLGAIPYGTTKNGVNNKLNLYGNAGTSYANVANTGSFYDFGYDLFVDRFGPGCNWTQAVNGGMCGTSGVSGDCYGSTSGTPANTIGTNGNVFYDTMGGNCYYKASGTWTTLNLLVPTSPTAVKAAYTNYPHLVSSTVSRSPTNVPITPPLAYLSQANANQVCQDIVDPNYGPKRLLRRREEVTAAAFQWIGSTSTRLAGDPGLLSSTAIGSIQYSGGSHTNTQSCNSDIHAGVSWANFASNAELAGNTSTSSQFPFVIGSDYTTQCVSRYGAQDLIGGDNMWISDQINCSTTTQTCAGVTSTVDPGNQDFTYTDGGYNFDGITGPGGTSAGQTAPNYTTSWSFASPAFGANYFSGPLGLPFVNSDHGNALLIGAGNAINTLLHSDGFNLSTTAWPTGTRGALVAGSNNGSSGRFVLNWGALASQVQSGPSGFTFRCALPAE